MPTGDLKATTIRSLFWKLFEQGGTAVVTLVVQVVMARLLAPEEFGILAIMLVFVNVGNVIVQSGLNTAIIQAPKADEHDYSTVFWMCFAVSAVLYLALFCAAPAIAGFYAIHQAVAPLRVLLLVLVVNSYNSVQEAIVARDLEFQKTFRATVSAGLVSGAAGISVALAGGGIWALVTQQLVQQLTKCVVLAAQVPWRPRPVFDPSRAARFFRFGWKLLASGIMEQLYQGLSDLLIGKVFTKVDLGFVSQGKKYPQALGTLLDGAIQPVMLSATSRVQQDRGMVKRLARRALKTSTFLVAPCMLLFAVVAEPVVRMLLGSQWVPCVPFLQTYCVVYALLPIHTTNLQVINGMGRSDLFLRLEVVKKVVGIAILSFTTFVLRDLRCIVGGYVVSAVLCTVINAAPNRKVIGYSYLEQVRDICPAFILGAASAGIGSLVTLLGLPDPALLAVQVVVVLGSYVLMAAALRVEELGYLLRTLRDMLRR